jgi:hypothetical protein
MNLSTARVLFVTGLAGLLTSNVACGDSASSGGDAGAPGPSGLPVPPGASDRPRPSGAPGNLTVLDWAGFKSALTYTFDDGQPSQIAHYAGSVTLSP